MWWNILYHTILSIAIVLLGHLIWEYFQTQSVSMNRPSGEKQSLKYKEIISQLQNQNQSTEQPPPISPHVTEYISPEEKQSMMDELKSLLMDGL